MLLLLAAFFICNVITANSYPYLLCDEYIFSEPAISYLHGQGFHVRFNEILSMYSFLLVPWIDVFGATLRVVRSASFLCMTLALGALWSAVKRLGLVVQPSHRIVLLLLLVSEFGMIVSYRVARYDSFGVLLVALLIWMFSIQAQWARIVALFSLSLFITWAGLQYLPVICVAGVLLILFHARRYWKEVAFSFLGVALGGITFLSAVWMSGRLSSYWKLVREQRRGVGVIHSLLSHTRVNTVNATPKDYSFPFLLVALAVLLYCVQRDRQLTARSALAYVAVYIPFASIVLFFIAKIPTGYMYFFTIPCLVGVFNGLPACKSQWVKGTVYALCGLSALIGIGLHAADYASDWRDRDYGYVEKFVNSAVRPDDVAYVEYCAYFPARAKAKDVYIQAIDWNIFPLMSHQEKDSVSVIIDRPENIDETIRGLGGSWYVTGERMKPTRRGVFQGRGFGFLSIENYSLLVLRRK